jgi:hypothetical protein
MIATEIHVMIIELVIGRFAQIRSAFAGKPWASPPSAKAESGEHNQRTMVDRIDRMDECMGASGALALSVHRRQCKHNFRKVSPKIGLPLFLGVFTCHLLPELPNYPRHE